MALLAQEKIQLENESLAALFSSATPKKRKIVAEGDSWFRYPMQKDIIEHLMQMGYAIKRVSRPGDTLDNMVYGSSFRISGNVATNEGPVGLEETLTHIRMNQPRFVLFSGGGNDIVGPEFEQYLNHKSSGLPLFKEEIFLNHVNTYMRTAIMKFLNSVWEIDPDIDILMDGYDYAKPNGTRYEIGFIGLSGPWLLPGFGRKAILNRITEQDPIIRLLVNGFNKMLENIAEQHPKFHYINLCGMFPNDDEWDNEIHLKSDGFRRVALEYHNRMTQILGSNPVDLLADNN